MILQNPLGLFALLVIPLFIILNLLRSKPKTLVVPSLLIWNKINPESRQNRTQRRFIFIITFIIQIVALSLLSLAVSNPSMVTHKQFLPETVVILDNSIGMKTTLDNNLTRWDLAVAQLKRWLKNQPPDSDIILIQTSGNNAGAVSKKASGMDSYLDTLSPKETINNWTDWVAKYSPRLNQIDTNQRFYFYSDRPLPEEITKALKAAPYQLLFGEKSHNIGITHISANTEKDSLSLLVNVKNFSLEEKKFSLSVYLDKETKKELPINLAPKREETFIIQGLTPITASIIEARLNIRDDLIADNRAFLAKHKKSDKVKICLTGKKSASLEKVFNAMPFVDYTYLEKIPESDSDYDICIFNNIIPASETDFSKVVILNPPADLYPFNVKEHSVIRKITYNNTNSPILKEVTLSGFHIWGSKGIEFTGEGKEYAKPLISSEDYILLAEWQKGIKHIIISGVNMEWLGHKNSDTDWSLTPYFPIFWVNLINYLSGNKEDSESNYGYYKTGTQDKTIDIIPENSGIYEIKIQNKTVPIAVNICSSRASDNNGVNNILDFSLEPQNIRPKILTTTVPLTFWLISAGLFLLILSWWLDKNK